MPTEPRPKLIEQAKIDELCLWITSRLRLSSQGKFATELREKVACFAQSREAHGEWVADWTEFIVDDLCSLCGNWGVIDSRAIRTPGGYACGGLHYCICPNGRTLKDHKVKKAYWLPPSPTQGGEKADKP